MVGVLVGSILVGVGLARASTALASTPPGGYTDIYRAALDVENGTATAVETEEVEEFADWNAYANGVTDPTKWPYPQNAATEPLSYPMTSGGYVDSGDGSYSEFGDGDTALNDLIASTADVPVGSSEAESIGGEIEDLGETTGIDPAVATEFPVLGLGVMDALVIGSDVREITGDEQPSIDLGAYGMQSVYSVWRQWENCGSPATDPPYGHRLDSQQAAYNFTYTQAEATIACSGLPGGGVYVLEEDTTQSDTKEADGNVGGLFMTAAQEGTCQNFPAYEFLPPIPGAASESATSANDPWVLDDVGNQATCSESGGTVTQPIDAGFAYEYKTRVHMSMPTSGSCATLSQAAKCITGSVNPSSSWSDNPATIAASLGDGNHGELRSFTNSSLGVGGYSPPGQAEIPSSCIGATVDACEQDLQAAGFVTTPSTTTLTDAEADLTKPAGNVVTTSPAPGSYLDTKSVVTLNLNPDPLPLAVPAPLSGGETYSAYIARLGTLGFTGTITDSPVSDTNENPAVGPNDVISTSPSAGTQVDPSTSVTVYSNPSDAPPGTGGSGSGPVGLTPPGISLPSIPTPCNVFPFAVPCWLYGQLSQLANQPAVAPSFSIGIPAMFGGGSFAVNLDDPFGVDLSSVMAVVRPVLLLLSILGLVVWLAGFAMGGSTGGGGGGGGAGED